MFDLISDAYVENATAKYSSTDKILELSNVEKDRGYALKIDEEEMFRFVISTSHFIENYEKTILITNNYAHQELPRNISIDVPLKFISTLLVKGTVYLLEQ